MNKKAYDLVAKNYKNEHKGQEYIEELEKFKFYLPENAIHVLDLGCGTADETIWIGENLSGAQVTGIDLSSEMVKLPTLLPPNVHLQEADMLTFIPIEIVHGIWARASIHHLTKDQIFHLFKHIVSYLEVGGVIGMVNKYGKDVETEQKQKYGELLERYFQYFDEKFVEEIAGQNNIQIVEQYVKENDHKWLVTFLSK